MPSYIKVISQRLILLLGAYFLCRFFFMLWNWHLYSEAPWGQIGLAYFYGLRFDLSAILFCNAILIPIWFLPSRWSARRWVQRFELSVFALVNSVALGMNIVDAEFFKFVGKRTSLDLLMLGDDLQKHSLNVILSYWKFCIGWLLLTFAVVYLAKRFKPDGERVLSFGFWIGRVVILALMILAMRGGFQFKPLHPMHAYFSTSHELGILTLNTPFTILKSRPTGEISFERYFATYGEAVRIAEAVTKPSRPPLGVAKKWNVVVLILESFSLEYMGAANDYPGYTPFLDSLSKKAFWFPLNFANARRSIEGLPAVLCGLPSSMDEPIITSDYANNRFDCLPKILAKNGYATHFLHGAHNGSMHFDTFSKIAGFENFVGLNEFPSHDKKDLDEHWGVLDEPMLQYAIKTIDDSPKPAMLSLFTLTSHHPYYIPPEYKGRFPKGTLDIHETIGYTDYALKRFFEVAATKPWFNNTIFVITADHTQLSDQAKYGNILGPSRVPLMIYTPGLKAGEATAPGTRITEQIDIVPSVLDLLGINYPERLLVGQSVFDQGKEGRAFAYNYVSYWQITPELLIDLGRGAYPSHVYKHKLTFDLQPTEAKGPVYEQQLLDLKATIQYMTEGLQKNSLHTWRESL